MGGEQGDGAGSGKSQEVFPPAHACEEGAHCLEVMDPKLFGFSSNPIPTPHCAASPWGRPSEGISQPALVPQAHALADFLPGTLGERAQEEVTLHLSRCPTPSCWKEGEIPGAQPPAWACPCSKDLPGGGAADGTGAGLEGVG